MSKWPQLISEVRANRKVTDWKTISEIATAAKWASIAAFALVAIKYSEIGNGKQNNR